MVTILMSFVVVPFTPSFVVADLNVGLLFFLAMSSLTAYSAVLAGWASNSKYALLGGLRASAQMLSYEVFMGLSVMGVVMLAGSFNLREIVNAQQGLWFCVPQFLGFVVFVIAGFAETKRIPFDMPEAESELVAGYHTEYSGMKFGMFYRRRVSRHPADFGADRRAVLRGLAGALAAAGPVVLSQDVSVYQLVHPHTGDAAAAAFRSIDGVRMEGHAAAGAAEPGRHRSVVLANRTAALNGSGRVHAETTQRHVARIRAHVPAPGDGAISGGAALPAAPVARADCSFA